MLVNGNILDVINKPIKKRLMTIGLYILYYKKLDSVYLKFEKTYTNRVLLNERSKLD